METVEHLGHTIGTRVAGSSGDKEAAAYLAEKAAQLGFEPRTEHFSFRAWRSTGDGLVHLQSGGKTLELVGKCLPYTLPTPPEGVAGTLRFVGPWPLIPERLTCELFTVDDAQGDPVAAVLVYPGGPARLLPNAVPLLSLPCVVVGTADAGALRDAAASGPEAVAFVRSGQHVEELVTSANVVFGSEGGRRTVVVVAHYDSVEGSPGANDNASGVAVLLRLARRFGEPSRREPGIRFVLLGAEEPFLVGSRQYVMSATSRGALAGVFACLNLDMLGVGDRLSLRRAKDGVWDVLAGTLDGGPSGTPVVQTPLPPSSDHWAFHEAGIPSAQLTREPDPAWHTPGDVVDRVSASLLDESEEVAAKLLEGALALAEAGETVGEAV